MTLILANQTHQHRVETRLSAHVCDTMLFLLLLPEFRFFLSARRNVYTDSSRYSSKAHTLLNQSHHASRVMRPCVVSPSYCDSLLSISNNKALSARGASKMGNLQTMSNITKIATGISSTATRCNANLLRSLTTCNTKRGKCGWRLFVIDDETALSLF